VVGGLHELPSVKLTKMPRMADFALWGEAVGRGLKWEADAFSSAYEDNRWEATETTLENSPVGKAVLEFALSRLEWECSPAELLELLNERVGKRVARSPAWPKSTERLTNELRRLAPQLRMRGLSVTFSRTRDSRRVRLVTAGFLAMIERT
jgi:hypothetical protein